MPLKAPFKTSKRAFTKCCLYVTNVPVFGMIFVTVGKSSKIYHRNRFELNRFAELCVQVACVPQRSISVVRKLSHLGAGSGQSCCYQSPFLAQSSECQEDGHPNFSLRCLHLLSGQHTQFGQLRSPGRQYKMQFSETPSCHGCHRLSADSILCSRLNQRRLCSLIA